MNIGFVTTWYERGAAYVTKQYADLLAKAGHTIFIYARGGHYAIGNKEWDLPYVTWGDKLYDTTLNINHVSDWIKNNGITCLFFNEQREMISVYTLRAKFPKLKMGTYIDYYTQSSVEEFKIFDFLICNTKRHYSVFSGFRQCYYVPWGTDINKFQYIPSESNCVRFFHSAGMSNRKGTDVLIDAFINGQLYKQSKLIIHTQVPIDSLTKISPEILSSHNIEIIEKTVTAPGLYHLGDVYVYPTTLDGLGLTMYEALSCGLPVITTDCAPMNEVIDDSVGKLVKVDEFKCRWDAYYWPLAYINKDSLIESMKFYIDHKDQLMQMRDRARETAVLKWNWDSRTEQVVNAFVDSKVLKIEDKDINEFIEKSKRNAKKQLKKDLIPFMPKLIQRLYFRNR